MDAYRSSNLERGTRTGCRILLALLLATSATGALAGTLYKCRAYSGGSFWSETPCDSRQAAGESRHNVPDGLTLQQRINLVEKTEKQSKTAQADEARELERRRKCGAIDNELSQIERRYSAGQHVPIEQVNADQKRTRDLKSQRSANRCYR